MEEEIIIEIFTIKEYIAYQEKYTKNMMRINGKRK